jgi:CRP-like cAMP-binding protein
MFGIERKMALLRRLSSFAACDRAALVALARIADEAVVEPGQVVCRQGGLARDCVAVVDGSLGVEIDGVRVATVGPGELVGELGILDGRPRAAAVIADEPTRLMVFTGPWFRTVVHDHARVREAVQNAAAAHRREQVAWVA